MCLTVFLHNLSPSPLWSPSWSGTLHFILNIFLQLIIVFFSQHMPVPSKLFCCSTEIMSSNPSLSQLFTWSWNSIIYLNVTQSSDHSIHPTILIYATEVPPHFFFLQARSHFQQHTTSHVHLPHFLSTCKSQTPDVQPSQNFLHTLTMTMTCSFSHVNVVSYILPFCGWYYVFL